MDLKDYFQEKKQILEFLQMHDLFPNVINDARIGIISTKVVNERTKYRSILFRNQKWTSKDTDKGATLNSVKGSRKRKGVSKQTPKQNGCTKEYYFKVFHLHIHFNVLQSNFKL